MDIKTAEGTTMEHDVGYWVWFLLIGGLVGWLAGLIVKGRGFGIVGDVVVGIIGALLGSWMFSALGVSTHDAPGAFFTALVGAVVLVTATRFFRLVA